MHSIASASEHMGQPTETGTFRSTLTVTPSKQDTSYSAAAEVTKGDMCPY